MPTYSKSYFIRKRKAHLKTLPSIDFIDFSYFIVISLWTFKKFLYFF